MFGNGTVGKLKVATTTAAGAAIMKTELFTFTKETGETKPTGNNDGWNTEYIAPNGKKYTKINPKFYDAEGNEAKTFTKGEKYFCSYDLLIDGNVIEVSANSFPGTYYCTGDTYARSEASGEDEFFQLIFPKAKVTSENTITLEAEGDPSTFNMNLRILRPADGIMMKLVKYNLIGESGKDDSETGELVHNHVLITNNAANANDDLKLKI